MAKGLLVDHSGPWELSTCQVTQAIYGHRTSWEIEGDDENDDCDDNVDEVNP